MAVCGGVGEPLGFSIHGADIHETKCVEDVLEAVSPANIPKQIFGDKAYDSQGLQHGLAAERDVELSAPLRKNSRQMLESDRKKQNWQKDRWKIERLFSWLKGFRRINMRWEYHPENFISWILLAAAIILFFRF